MTTSTYIVAYYDGNETVHKLLVDITRPQISDLIASQDDGFWPEFIIQVHPDTLDSNNTEALESIWTGENWIKIRDLEVFNWQERI